VKRNLQKASGLAGILRAAGVVAFAAMASAAEPNLTFEKDVRPLLKAHCTLCHGEEANPKGGVDLRLRRLMDAPTDSGAILLVPGNPEASELVAIIERGEMPKKGHPVPPAELAVIRKWVAQGAKTARPEPESLERGPLITEEERLHWSFQPVKRPEVPKVEGSPAPVDAFLAEAMAKEGLDFAPEADRVTWLRRVTVDLTGLPPKPEEVDAFLADSSPQAREKVVDRLLASPAYGERWARHWLDVVGYADSNGYTAADSARPQAWRYRDYVIRSFNEDKPWDQFIREQLAGDELAGATHADYQAVVNDPKRLEQLTATAFLRMAPDGTGDPNDDANLARNQVIAEQLKIVSSSLLGLTVACAQCHDHRHDPISQEDYYRFRAIFDPAYHWEAWRAPAQRLYSLYTPEESAKAAEIEKAAAAIDAEARAMSKKFLDEIFEVEVKKLPEDDREPYRKARATAEKDRTPGQKALIKKYPSALALYSLDLYDAKKQEQVNAKSAEAAKLRATKPVQNFVMALTEVKGQVPETKLFNRGDHDQPVRPVTPGELTVLARPEIEPFHPAAVPAGSSGRRLAYANWLTSGKHPLVARVLVNRFWMLHFGRGLVNTPGDFGFAGERPSHPELLDWLADEFVKGGWKLKPFHKQLVLSRAYCQSADHPASSERDPDNRLFARHKLRRLEAEALRDTILATAGALVEKPYGPPSAIARDPAGRIVVGIDKGTITSFKVEPGGEQDFRRSLYVQVTRSKPVTVLETFDAPVMVPHCEKRNQTTVAPQSLLLMNDTFVLENARRLADRLHAAAPSDESERLRLAWRLLFSTEPDESDLARAHDYLRLQTASLIVHHAQNPPAAPAKGAAAPPKPDPAREALASLCQVLYSSNRFLYLE
jgi:cytochrome c553